MDLLYFSDSSQQTKQGAERTVAPCIKPFTVENRNLVLRAGGLLFDKHDHRIIKPTRKGKVITDSNCLSFSQAQLLALWCPYGEAGSIRRTGSAR